MKELATHTNRSNPGQVDNEKLQQDAIKPYKTIKLKLTTISPIHIGSGDLYEPTNFTIDGNMLYLFDDEQFFSSLKEIERTEFMQIVNENRADSFVRVNKFVKKRANIVKKIAKRSVPTTVGVQADYNGKAGEFGTNEKGTTNEFKIQKIQRKLGKTKNGSYVEAGYIVGSSLKGAISTAYQEFISNKEGKEARARKFLSPSTITQHLFKNLKVSDSLVKSHTTKIGYALNKKRKASQSSINEPFDFRSAMTNYDKNSQESTLYTPIEVIEANSLFTTTITYKEVGFEIKEVLESLNSHYLPIFRTIFTDDYASSLDQNFKKTYQDLQLKENQCLIRVGKHSGARSVTIDSKNEPREITIRLGDQGSVEARAESTTWLFGERSNSTQNLLPFGWILCEVVE